MGTRNSHDDDDDGGDGDDDPLRPLHQAHSTLARMMAQVDHLVLKAHKMGMDGRRMQGLDVKALSKFLSDMASSLQGWVPQLEMATRTEESMVEEHVKEEKHMDLISPLLEDEASGRVITEQCHKGIEAFDVDHGTCPVEERNGEESDEHEQQDCILSNSPLVPYLDRVQFFMLTPMAKCKKALSEPSRKVVAKGRGTIPYPGDESSWNLPKGSIPHAYTSVKDNGNSSTYLLPSPINDAKQQFICQSSSAECSPNIFEGHSLCSDLSSVLLLTPRIIRTPLYRQLSGDSAISDSPLHICEAFPEQEFPVGVLPITPENPTHPAHAMENANTPLPPQSLVKRYSNFFILDSSCKKMALNRSGAIAISDSRFSFEENASGTLLEDTPVNSHQKCIFKKGTPYPHRSLLKKYSDDFGDGGEFADSICELSGPASLETPALSLSSHSSKGMEPVISEDVSPSSDSATPIRVKHQANHATPLPPQSLVKRYANILGSSDKSKNPSSKLPCSLNANKTENLVPQSFVLKETKSSCTDATPSEQCLQSSASGGFEMATPLPPQSLMKRYSQFLCGEEELTDLATPLTPMLAISPPKTCVLMRPSQTNGTTNLKQSLSQGDQGCIKHGTPFRTPGLEGKNFGDHAFYEDMDLTNFKKPNQHLQNPFQTTRVMTPSSAMQLLTVKKPSSIKRTPLVDLQFSTIKKPGAPLPGEQTLKRELWSRMEAEFSSMENVCKSLFTEALPLPAPPKYGQIHQSDTENRNPNSKPKTRTVKPATRKPLLARKVQQRQRSTNKAC